MLEFLAFWCFMLFHVSSIYVWPWTHYWWMDGWMDGCGYVQGDVEFLRFNCLYCLFYWLAPNCFKNRLDSLTILPKGQNRTCWGLGVVGLIICCWFQKLCLNSCDDSYLRKLHKQLIQVSSHSKWRRSDELASSPDQASKIRLAKSGKHRRGCTDDDATQRLMEVVFASLLLERERLSYSNEQCNRLAT